MVVKYKTCALIWAAFCLIAAATWAPTQAQSAIPEEFGPAGTIEVPARMLAAEEDMKRIQSAKAIKKSDKAAMEKEYQQLRSEFKRVWTPLEASYNERVQLPAAYLKQVRELEHQLQEHDDPGLRRQLAELRADYPGHIKALNRIIELQKAAVTDWSKARRLTEFLTEANRMLTKNRQ